MTGEQTPEDGPSPGELLVRARGGDGAAWARLVDRYSELLWAIARSYRLGRADAGDVVQTCWLRLVERIDRIERPEAVGSWLAVTARHESMATARRAGRSRPLADQSLLDASDPLEPERVAVARDQVDRVANALRKLPDRCRALLPLLAAAPSYAEVSEVLGLPIGSIGPTRARCLDKLRRLTE